MYFTSVLRTTYTGLLVAFLITRLGSDINPPQHVRQIKEALPPMCAALRIYTIPRHTEIQIHYTQEARTDPLVHRHQTVKTESMSLRPSTYTAAACIYGLGARTCTCTVLAVGEASPYRAVRTTSTCWYYCST